MDCLVHLFEQGIVFVAGIDRLRDVRGNPMDPMTPHLAEEIWNMLGGQGLVIDAAWPVADPSMLVDDTVTMPIQINGKRRAEISVAKDMPKEEVEKLALAHDAVVKALDGNSPKKLIVVPGRIINVVI